MARTLDEIREDVKALPANEREELLDELLDEFDRAQLAEWERRAEELRTGAVKGIPLEDAVRRLREKYSGGHSS